MQEYPSNFDYSSATNENVSKHRGLRTDQVNQYSDDEILTEDDRITFEHAKKIS